MSANKYNAKKIVVDGITFDSKTEAGYYLLLKGKQKKGEIESLDLQQEFILLDAFTHKATGKKYRKTVYTADFVITYKGKDGEIHTKVVEVKSKATAKARDYGLRKKLFVLRYPDIEFEEVIV